MNKTSEDDWLFREAVDLAIRLQSDPGNPVSIEVLRSWVARSPVHKATWVRVANIHGMTGHIFYEQDKVTDDEPLLSRRNLMIAGLCGLGAAATGGWVIPRAMLQAKSTFMTATAEIRKLELPDGSIMTLGPQSAIAIRYSEIQRGVELFTGMAFVEVAKDINRPFSILSGTLSATALGTAFDVSNDAGLVSVSVDHGVVEARSSDNTLQGEQRLEAGEWLTYDASAHSVTRGSRNASQIAAWRSGTLIAENENVSTLVAKISKWQKGVILVADPWLGSRTVSGVFDLNNPLSALEAVVRPFGAKVRQIGAYMTVISSV